MLSSSGDKRVAVWNRLRASPSQIQIQSIEVLQSNVFAPQTITFDRTTVIVGTHGTGKTLLLRILEHCFGGWAGSDGPPYLEREVIWRLPDDQITGTFRVSVSVNGHIHTETINLSEPHESRRDRWLIKQNKWFGPEFASPISMIYNLAIYFQDYYPPSDEDITEVQTASASDLAALRAVTGRAYESLSINTVSTEVSHSPHFDVSAAGRSYDNAMMSLGELWATYAICWIAGRSEGDPLLLDEPEAFIATRGHRALIDEIARRALRSDSQFLVATHAPNIIARYPIENVRLCVRGKHGIHVVVPRSVSQIFDSIGVDIPTNTILFVEDNFAAIILKEICFALDPYLLRGTETIAAGGESEALSGLRVLSRANHLRSLAILDGDMRGKHLDPSVLYLPGNKEPEQELVTAAGLNPSILAEALDRTTDDIIAALDLTSSTDHQYWIASIASYLAVADTVVIRALVATWLRDSEVTRSALSLLSSIRVLADV